MSQPFNPYRDRSDSTDETADHGRWLVSYADFITLLFAFFVVMYSISSVNNGKFRVLSNSIGTGFNAKTTSDNVTRVVPIDLGGAVQSPADAKIPPQNTALLDSAAASADGTSAPIDLEPVPRQGTAVERLQMALGPLVKNNDMRIRDTPEWTEIELSNELLFRSGSADLKPRSLPAIRQIAAIALTIGKTVRIEGHTDNVPLSVSAFPSNWHLSAARAATIAEQLAISHVPPERLSAVGYGEYRPVADNATEEGRVKNRRVVIAIAKHAGAGVGVSGNSGPGAGRTLKRIEILPLPAEIGR